LEIGVYKILNKINNKVYIGSSYNVNKRFKDHIRNLRSNNHINKHLQSSYNKYGEKSFEFIIIVKVSKSILRKAEQIYINKYQSDNPKYGYNKSTVISHSSDFKNSQVIIKTNSNYFGCYDKSGKIVKVFRTIEDVHNFLGNRYTRIYEAITSNLTKTCKNYYWIRLDVSKEKFPRRIFPKNRKGRHRSINQYDLDGVLIKTWSSAVEAATNLNLSSYNITRCLKKNGIYKKFKWTYSAP